jgi:Glyoxalase-like domain
MAADDDFSDSSNANEEDEKMNQLLAEWDEKDDQDDVFDDSDEDGSDDDAAAEKKKAALKQKRYDSEEEDDVDEDEKPKAKKSAAADEDDDEDDDDAEYEIEEVEVDASEEEEEEQAEVEEQQEEEEEEEEEEEKEEEVVEEKPKKSSSKKSKSRSKDEDDDVTYMSADTRDNGEPEAIVDELKKKPKKKKEKVKPKKVTEISEDDDDEDKAMKALLANWDADNGDDDDEDDDDDDDDDDSDNSEISEREVVLDDNVIDHIVLAAPDLEEAMGEFEKKTGLAAVIAGTIKGLGIKCARVSFTDSTYLEIIAPDPKGPGPIGELIKAKGIKELTPFHFAIRTTRAEQLKDEVTQFGYTPDHITMFGAKSDGTPRKWEMLYLYGHGIGGTCPFFINWANSDHPCATLPVVGKLKKLTIRAPEDDPVHKLLEHVGVKDINVEIGDKPKLAVSFSSPEGTVKFSSHKAVGFKFPGFEADAGGAVPGDDGEQDADVVFDDPKFPELLDVDDDGSELETPLDDDFDGEDSD